MQFGKDLHIEGCSCDLDLMEEIKKRSIKRKSNGMIIDSEGNELLYVDSFGMRGPIPGESKDCYNALIKQIIKDMKGSYD